MFRIQKTSIEDPLLRCAVDGTPHRLPHLPEIPMNHCWNAGKLRFGHVYLTLITRNVFNLHRIPGYGERAFSKLHLRERDKIEFIFSKITEEDLRKSTKELTRIYEFTQTQLRNSFGDKVTLYRGLDLKYSSLYKYGELLHLIEDGASCFNE